MVLCLQRPVSSRYWRIAQLLRDASCRLPPRRRLPLLPLRIPTFPLTFLKTAKEEEAEKEEEEEVQWSYPTISLTEDLLLLRSQALQI